MKLKKCNTCNEHKKLSNFSRSKTKKTKDGKPAHLDRCKLCGSNKINGGKKSAVAGTGKCVVCNEPITYYATHCREHNVRAEYDTGPKKKIKKMYLERGLISNTRRTDSISCDA